MGDMMEELSIELKAQERIGDVKQNEKWHNEQRGNRSSTEALHVEQGKQWVYCKQKHYSLDRCRIVTNIHTRNKNVERRK